MLWAAPAVPPAGHCHREELHGAYRWKSLPKFLLMAPDSCLLATSTHPSPAKGRDLPQGSGCGPTPLLRCCLHHLIQAKPDLSWLLLLLFLGLGFSSADITFPCVAITTGIKSLLTLPSCANYTISCHCYIPVISFALGHLVTAFLGLVREPE